jgi:hypothetical protein
MADNVGYTPGTGATISADEIAGILFQRIKLTLGADGVNDGDVSASNPMPVAVYGELIDAIEAMRMAIQSLNRTIGLAQVNPLTGRMLVDGAGVTQPVSGTVTATGTIAATQSGAWNITNLATIGGVAANSEVQSFERMTADNLRRNIIVT